MKISRFTFFVLPLLGAALFFVLEKKMEKHSLISSSKPKIRLALNWVAEPEFGGFYAAKMMGLYDSAGLDVEIVPGGAGSPTIQMVAAGQVELAISSASEVLTARDRGADVISAYAVYHTSPMAIMVHDSRKLGELADVFKSGTLAIQKGQAFSLFLEKKYGFSKIQVVPYTGSIGPFLHDTNLAQQCFVFSEPLHAEKENVPTKTFLIADSGYNPYIEVVAMKADYLKNNKEIVDKFVTATRAGWDLYIKNPAPTNVHMSELNKSMPLTTFNDISKRQMPFIIPRDDDPENHLLGFMSKERWESLGAQLIDLGILKNPPDIGSSFINL